MADARAAIADLSTADKRALLAKLLAGKQPAIAPAVPASSAQRRMWLLEQLDPGTPVYNIPMPLRLRGELDESALQRAVTEIVRRHQALRTTFAMDGDVVVQRVGPPAEVPMPIHDLSIMDEPDRSARAEALVQRFGAVVFDLAAGPLIRTELVRLDALEHVLLLCVHHIVFDGWSRGVFCRELAECYAAYRRGANPVLPELALQYPDFSVRQIGDVEQRLAYWRRQLADVPPVEMPATRLRPATPGWRGGRVTAWLPDGLVTALNELSRTNRTTLFTTLLAAFQTLVFRYTGAEDIAVATPIAGRTSIDVENLIGLFVNTLVLRTRLSGDPSFGELLARTSSTAIAAYSHQDLPYERVVEELRPARDLGRLPFTQLMFVFQNVPDVPLALAGLTTEWLDVDVGTAKSDLQLVVATEDGRMGCVWMYRTDLYEQADVERFNHAYMTLLDAIAADPTTRISDLPLGDEAAPPAGTGPTLAVPDTCLHDLVSAHAVRTPDASAVDDGTRRLTYAELDAAANAVAAELVTIGVGRGDLVGVHADRSTWMVAAILGVLKVGAAYVPLDPHAPVERLRDLAAEAGLAAVLTDSSIELGLPVLRIRSIDAQGGPVWSPGCPDDVAYVLFTSGSTGKPKGVAVPHRAVVNYLVGIQEECGLRADATYGMAQPLAVDSSVLMLWGSLLAGGLLVLIDKATALDGPALAQRLAGTPLDYLKIAPSHLAALHSGLDPVQLMPRQWLSIAGEASQWDWSVRLAGLRPGCRVFNHYGPTETTVAVTSYQVDPDDEPCCPTTPLGGALANARVRVLDQRLRPVPPMVPGELFVSGPGVAHGYHRQPALTAAAFLPDPFAAEPGARMYRTGDLARWRPDGTLEFLGRVDHQVKIRGNRVEPAEIVAVLRDHPDVHEAVVTTPAGGPDLVAYVTARDDAVVQPAELREFVAGRLPAHMVPGRVIPMTTLPLTAHGKVDVRALANVEPEAVPEADLTGASPTAVRVAAIWRRLLDRPSVGPRDDFFDLGGNSLQATRLVARLTAEFGVRVPLREVFAHPTLAALTEVVENRVRTGTTSASASSSATVPFGHGHGAPHVFWAHPVSGTVGCYLDLANLLAPDYSVVGLQSPDLEADSGPRTTIGELAAIYVDAVISAQPDGVYRLAGWSMGGLIAFEMARLLRALGRTVAPVVVVDSYLGSPAESPLSAEPPWKQAARFAANVAASEGRATLGPGPELRADVAEADLAAVVRDWLIGTGTINEGVPVSVIARRLAVFRANVRALDSYAGGSYDGEVVLVRAAAGQDQVDGWAALGLRLATHVLPGDHFSLPHSPALAELVRRTFDATR